MSGKKRALISVFDKTGVAQFAKELERLGFEIVSTGGTSKALREAGIAVVDVTDVTGFPECLEGRVKTLHPLIHAGILAMRGNPLHMRELSENGAVVVDVVCCNLYPFKQTISRPGVTLQDAIENIDIGGPSMLRAAAKNWQDVYVLVDPADYATVIDELKRGESPKETKFKLSLKVFEHTAAYDALIASYLREKAGGGLPDTLTLTFEKAQELRYGENPHQNALFYREPLLVPGTITDAKQLHGKELSFCNINDANGALDLLKEFDEPCVVACKHANPCGVGLGEDVYEAWQNAYSADPVSIFGGVIVMNRPPDVKVAEEIAGMFIEIVIAPSFPGDVFDILSKKKNIRLLELSSIERKNTTDMLDIKKVGGGLLVQYIDTELLLPEGYTVATERAPTEDELRDMLFAWRVVKHVKSNAIALAKGKQTIGIGPGQLNRVGALQIAVENAGERAKGAAMASDAYLPMSDSVGLAAKSGITAIIQPGGSIKDQASIDAANAAGIAMIFTGMRHFKH